jgi:hypothetical protein
VVERARLRHLAFFTDMFAQALILLGVIINIVGCIKFWVAAKQVSTGWFIGCLFIVVWPFFLFAHFYNAWIQFAIWFAGLIIAGIGTMISGG